MKKILVAVAAAAGLAVAGIATPALADTPPSDALHVTYDAVGTSHIAKPNANIKLGPTVLSTYLNPDGTFVGSLPIPTAGTSFKVIGLVPVSSDVTFIQVKPKTSTPDSTNVTGALGTDASNNVTVNATAYYILRLSNVKLAGIPTPVGNSCQTAAPVSIPVQNPKGTSFDITNGGPIVGTYTIGNFANCGLTTGLINALVPGSGNTVNLTLSNGQIGS